jgi:alkylhydroperoxidase family enzyme
MTIPKIAMLGIEASKAIAEEVGVPLQLAELNVFRTLLVRPKTAKALSDLLLSMLFGGDLDDRLRELVIMRIGWSTGCDYEWTQHWAIAPQRGCSEAELLALREPDTGSFGEVERAVLAATDECLARGAVSDATLAACRRLLGEPATLELVTAIGCWRMISHLARSLAIPLEEGVVSWPPDGVDPGSPIPG